MTLGAGGGTDEKRKRFLTQVYSGSGRTGPTVDRFDGTPTTDHIGTGGGAGDMVSTHKTR